MCYALEMSTFKVTIGNATVEVSTLAEAAELARLYDALAESRRAARAERISAVVSRALNPDNIIAPEHVSLAAAFLNALSDFGPSGGATERIQKALGVATSKAVGSRMATVNRVLETLGFKPHEIYSNTKTANGRVWKSGKKLGEALDKIVLS
jgi:hypothetical protein